MARLYYMRELSRRFVDGRWIKKPQSRRFEIRRELFGNSQGFLSRPPSRALAFTGCIDEERRLITTRLKPQYLIPEHAFH